MRIITKKWGKLQKNGENYKKMGKITKNGKITKIGENYKKWEKLQKMGKITKNGENNRKLYNKMAAKNMDDL